MAAFRQADLSRKNLSFLSRPHKQIKLVGKLVEVKTCSCGRRFIFRPHGTGTENTSWCLRTREHLLRSNTRTIWKAVLPVSNASSSATCVFSCSSLRSLTDQTAETKGN